MQFTVSRDNEQFGPYTLEQLHQYVNEGSIYPHDLVFDGQNWVNVGQIINPQQQAQITSFAAPQITQHPKAQRVQQGPNLGNVVGPMFNSQKWIRFMSVLGFITAGGQGVFTIFVLLTGGGVFLFLYSLTLLIIEIYGAKLLWEYANSINVLRGVFQINNLKSALEIQSRFWTFTGIVTLVFIVLFLLFILLLIVGIGSLALNLPEFPNGN
ncbi:MAG: DUF4339 domain-containing protein [Verrucomicrobiota bacterium]|nr:DUF4339 domain-containing protein [Verrucomicrobiota bacterium]